jgi:hypothetical protein
MTPTAAKTLVFILANIEDEISNVPEGNREEAWNLIVETIRDKATDQWGDHAQSSLRGMARQVNRFLLGQEHVSLQQLQVELQATLKLGSDESTYDKNIQTITDRVIELLAKPLGRHLLNEAEFNRLRKAILDPLEYSKVLSDEEVQLNCHSCTRSLSMEQGMVFSGQPIRFYCTTCLPVRKKFCDAYRCPNAVALGTVFCEEHSAGAAPANPIESHTLGIDEVAEIAQNFRMPVRAVRANPAMPPRRR